jgi:hypothetical protein
MIRALIGMFVLHCLDKAGERANRKAVVHEVDLARMTHAQGMNWIKGRPIDFSQTGCKTVPFRGRVS